jgi:hypothetical protein
MQQHLTDEMAIDLIMRVRQTNKEEAIIILKRIRGKK